MHIVRVQSLDAWWGVGGGGLVPIPWGGPLGGCGGLDMVEHCHSCHAMIGLFASNYSTDPPKNERFQRVDLEGRNKVWLIVQGGEKAVN